MYSIYHTDKITHLFRHYQSAVYLSPVDVASMTNYMISLFVDCCDYAQSIQSLAYLHVRPINWRSKCNSINGMIKTYFTIFLMSTSVYNFFKNHDAFEI